MKKVLLSLFIGFSPFLSAQDTSVNDLKLTSQKTEAAIEVFNTEIKQFEDCYSSREYPNKKLLSMYNERADLNFAKRNYQDALKDYQNVISYIENANMSEPADLLWGICGCLFCHQCLEDDESAKQEFNRLVYNVALL